VSSPRLAAKWDLGGEARAVPRNAFHLEPPAEGLDPVAEASQARSKRGIGPTDTVVLNEGVRDAPCVPTLTGTRP
jgi:hypothetical protein